MANSTTTSPLPEIFVGRAVITQRTDNYKNLKHQLLSQALGKPETKSILYTKDHVKTWLDEMDYWGADGMRIYLGAYGENEGDAAGQICLLVVLTRSNADGTAHFDVILEEEDNFAARSGSTARVSARGFILNKPGKAREYNYGSPCPPACTQGATF